MKYRFVKYSQGITSDELVKKCSKLANSNIRPIYANIIRTIECSTEKLNEILYNGVIPDHIDYGLLICDKDGIWNCICLQSPELSVLCYTSGHKQMLYLAIINSED